MKKTEDVSLVSAISALHAFANTREKRFLAAFLACIPSRVVNHPKRCELYRIGLEVLADSAAANGPGGQTDEMIKALWQMLCEDLSREKGGARR